MATVYVINGPNLNLLGTREPDVYGSATLQDMEQLCRDKAKTCALDIDFFQSNYEGALVEHIHTAIKTNADAIVINPAAYTHTSVAILDALSAFTGTVIEVHLSNIHKREAFRHHSYVSRRADAIICGFGIHGYVYALDTIAQNLLGQS